MPRDPARFTVFAREFQSFHQGLWRPNVEPQVGFVELDSNNFLSAPHELLNSVRQLDLPASAGSYLGQRVENSAIKDIHGQNREVTFGLLRLLDGAPDLDYAVLQPLGGDNSVGAGIFHFLEQDRSIGLKSCVSRGHSSEKIIVLRNYVRISCVEQEFPTDVGPGAKDRVSKS